MTHAPEIHFTAPTPPDRAAMYAGLGGWTTIEELGHDLGWPANETAATRAAIIDGLAQGASWTVLEGIQERTEDRVIAAAVVYPTPLDTFREPIVFVQLEE